MKSICVSLEHRFYSHNGMLFTKLAFNYDYWKTYLTHFSKVTIIARVCELDKIDSSYVRVDGEGVDYIAMPYYKGVAKFVLSLAPLLKVSRKAALENNYFLLRSGNVSNLVWVWLMLYKKAYIREYPGNIYEGIVGFAGNSIKTRLLASFLNYIAKVQARYSRGNSFVSEYCKDLYSSSSPSFVFSSFNADEIVEKKTSFSIKGTPNILSLGRLEGEKGHKDLISIAHKLDKRVKVSIIGDGSRRLQLEEYAESLGVEVIFYGAITNRDKIFSLIREADIFMLPSHTEGLPRSLLEAMASGLPCVGSSVGGIPELLKSDFLYSVQNLNGGVDILNKLIKDEALRVKCSKDNLSFIAEHYTSQKLNLKKKSFWNCLND